MATASAAVLIGAAFAMRKPLFAVGAPLVDFAIAQASHRGEQQKTQPWRRSAWHLRAELRLLRSTLREETRALRRRVSDSRR